MLSISLFCFLLVGLIVVFFLNNKDFLAPSFIFLAAFAASLAAGLSQLNNWKFNLHVNTCILIFSSCLVFALTSISVHSLFIKRSKSNSVRFCYYRIPSIVLIAVVTFQLIFVAFLLRHVLDTVSNFTGVVNQDRTNIIGVYDQIVKSVDSGYKFPFVLKLAEILISSVCYFNSFVLMNNLLFLDKSNRKRIVLENIPIVLSIVIYMFGTLITGGRSELIWYFLALFAIFYILYLRKKCITSLKYTLKSTVVICCCLAISVAIFFISMLFVGRNLSGYSSLVQYFTIYLGGPVKNLDIFMQSDIIHPDLFGNETFKSLYNIFDIPTQDAGLSQYQHIGDYWFGNVYTMLAGLYYDFGLVGTLILIAIFAIIFQLVYDLAKSSSSHFFIIYILVYGYLMRGLVFVFFDNLFTTSILSFGFLMRIVVWLFATIVVERLYTEHL